MERQEKDSKICLWLRRKAGCKKTLWKKSTARKKHLRGSVFCSKTQSKLVDKMTTAFWKRYNWFAGDPYQMFHDGTNLQVQFRAFTGSQLWTVDLCVKKALLRSCLENNSSSLGAGIAALNLRTEDHSALSSHPSFTLCTLSFHLHIS